jgi:hypothetical protein
MRASALVTSEAPPGLPPGAHRALHALVGVATPTARDLGNALRRVQEQRIEGIPLAVTRKVDGHGFAMWQVVPIGSETSTTVERPNPAELIRSALTGLGYRPGEAQYAIAALGSRVEVEPLEKLVREALGVLGQRAAPGAKRR